MKSCTPTEAHRMFDEFFTAFQAAGRAVIRGSDLEAFNAAASAAEATAKLPPSAATCLELERYLGLMFSLFFDAPLFWAKHNVVSTWKLRVHRANRRCNSYSVCTRLRHRRPTEIHIETGIRR